MLPTFVIGLREGLEAALIVSIIATFLRRNGAGLRSMWIGVGVAVALSIGVGIVLQVVEQNLPQREQEGMETVIGLIAVFFVTGMVLWMRTHARFMRRDLEAAAGDALTSGTTTALTVMAFLAVMREGFETSVFLLATFQAASSGTSAAVGAVLGIAVAVGIGFGIYKGGVRLNLGRFFAITSVFLIFVAAGLVLSAARTAHEAGWLLIGQARTVDLSWLAPAGSVRSALISGVLGMPADPRAVELLAWGCYLLPVLALVYWPQAWRPTPARLPLVRTIGAGALVLVAVALVVVVRTPATTVPATAPLSGGGRVVLSTSGDTGTLTLTRTGGSVRYALSRPTASTTDGADTSWHLAPATSTRPSTLGAAALLTFTGGRAPVGLNLGTTPGPFTAHWTEKTSATVLTRDGGLVQAGSTGRLLLTLTGGGLTSPRVFAVDDPTGPVSWRVPQSYVNATGAAITAADQSASDRTLWQRCFPAFLAVLAAGLLLTNLRDRRRARTALAPSAPSPVISATPVAPVSVRSS